METCEFSKFRACGLHRKQPIRRLKLAQMGGSDDIPISLTGGTIARNLTVSEWLAPFRTADVIEGIGSWALHGAVLLNVPQITFYGSTHPDHVASKPYYRSKAAPALLIAPNVSCSPCNSLSCLYQPEAFCPGYNVDRGKIVAFLRDSDVGA